MRKISWKRVKLLFYSQIHKSEAANTPVSQGEKELKGRQGQKEKAPPLPEAEVARSAGGEHFLYLRQLCACTPGKRKLSLYYYGLCK